MLSTCFFPNASSVVEEEGNNSENDERKHSISSRCDEEIEMTFDDDVAQDLREEVSTRDDADKHGSSSGNNIIGDFAVFRDFFLAAFSDGYYKVSLYFSYWAICSIYVRIQEFFISINDIPCFF